MTARLLRGRLADADSAPASGERVERLLSEANVVVEHIVSGALERPVPYRQVEDEWVVLLSGRARLRIRDEELALTAGDWLFLPAGLEHELMETTRGSTWLAVFVEPSAAPGA